MYLYRGKTALITGASFGIGEAFAHALAERGMQVILVARTESRLRALAEKLHTQYGIDAEVIVADLSLPEAPAQIFQATQDSGRSVDLLVNNAGFGTPGAFVTIDPTLDHQQIMVNAGAVVGLSHAFLPQMLERKEGAILNVASLASLLPTPYSSVYGASKAFVLSFSIALWAEYRQSGIRVVAVCPALVRTHFFEAAGMQMPTQGGGLTISSPETVVLSALRALEHGKTYVIPGRFNYVIANMVRRILPLGTIAQMAEKANRVPSK